LSFRRFGTLARNAGLQTSACTGDTAAGFIGGVAHFTRVMAKVCGLRELLSGVMATSGYLHSFYEVVVQGKHEFE
jgi:hypothetical protein